MYVCPEIKVVYLAQPRTASRSLRDFLFRHTQTHQIGNHHHMNEKSIEKAKDNGYRVVTAVRNHWDIMVSWWHHNPNWFNRSRDKGDATFSNFVRDFTSHQNNKYVAPHRMYYRYQPVATHIIRYENLWDEFAEVTGMRIVQRQRVHSGKSERKPYPDYYDEDTRHFIGEWYKHEIEQYGYTYDDYLKD